ncbi:KH domain-containing protein [Peribacillus saganii]|uniref:RNA-binding protein KhpA n=1 Tax=Peribacillus saganii TaxID=2303992 RepID=A0A372LT40_9BACI|nr:KH domain-containing protein [Peribacillus saganii]RFU71381.1 KH domain-containing protein [Peribacillus saganii]
MKELIEAIVTPLVEYPDEVQVTSKDEDDRITYYLAVNKEDMGKVIGKQGRVAKAIRTVVYAAGASQHKKIYLEISE